MTRISTEFSPSVSRATLSCITVNWTSVSTVSFEGPNCGAKQEYNALRRVATQYSALRRVATLYSALRRVVTQYNALRRVATQYDALRRVATQHNVLRRVATQFKTDSRKNGTD